jgi:hypothetical protein
MAKFSILHQTHFGFEATKQVTLTAGFYPQWRSEYVEKHCIMKTQKQVVFLNLI